MAVSFEEREWIDRPILPQGLDHIQVGNEEDGTESSCAPVTDDKIHVLRVGPEYADIVLCEACCPQPHGHCLGGFCAADVQRRIDFDQLLKYVAGQFLMRVESRGSRECLSMHYDDGNGEREDKRPYDKRFHHDYSPGWDVRQRNDAERSRNFRRGGAGLLGSRHQASQVKIIRFGCLQREW